MYKSCFTVIVILILASCATTKKFPEKRCKSFLVNDFKNILEEKFVSITNNDTLFLNEIKYECVYTAMYTQKGMYDRFGKWDKEIYPEEKHHPILLWNNVKLFPKDTTEFRVAANGLESRETIYASVLVFDKQNNDMLSDKSEYKTKLIAYFSEMIKNNKSRNDDFYEIYWKTVDPEAWKEIQRHKKNR